MRLWLEELGHDQRDIRMQVQHVLSGETCYFREWSKLVAYVECKVQEVTEEASRKGGDAHNPIDNPPYFL